MKEIIRELNSHRSLLWALTKRQILEQYKGSVLGVFWSIINPILFFCIYYFVFGVIFNGTYYHNGVTYDSNYYALGIFLSLSVFRFIAEVLSESPKLIARQPSYVKKVVFPLSLLSIIQVLSSGYNFIISILLFLVGAFYLGISISGISIVFVFFIPLFFLLLGLSYLLSSMGVFLKDIAKISDVLVLVLLYASAVFYSSADVKQMSPAIWSILKLNPFLYFIEGVRAAMLWQEWPDLKTLGLIYGSSLFVFSMGCIYFSKSKKQFADVL